MKLNLRQRLLGWLHKIGLLPQRLTRRTAAEDLLKAIYEARTTPSSSPSPIASLELSEEDQSELIAELRREGYLLSEGMELTPLGEQRAIELTRAHRLYELYLAEHSGYSPKEWHRLAHAKEHELTAKEHERIAKLLGNPLYDPHGDPIPTSQGLRPSTPSVLPLEQLHEGRW